jgi:hypothetical protein
MITHLSNTPFSILYIIKKIAFLSVFAMILLCVQCKKKETACVSCTVKFKELTSGFEGSLPLSTLSECEEAKAEVGKTTVDNGQAITITEVVCK